MSQLITTSDIKDIKLLIARDKDINNSYQLLYKELESLLSSNVLQFFAKPVFKTKEKLNWYTELDGKLYPFSKASEYVEEPIELLKIQAQRVYFDALKKQNNLQDKKKVVEFIDLCLSLTSENDIFLIIPESGDKRFVITNWCQSNADGKNILANVVDIKKVDVTITLTIKGKPTADKEVFVKYKDEEKLYVSDSEGNILIKELDLLEHFEVFQKENEKVVNKKRFLIDKNQFYFELSPSNIQRIVINAIDQNNEPLSNTKLFITVNNQKREYLTDENGTIVLNNIPIGAQITVEQYISDTRSIQKTYTITSITNTYLTFKGRKISGNYLIIKVLDANNRPFSYALVQIIYNNTKLLKTANEDGIVVINDIPINAKVTIKLIVNNIPVSSKNFIYTTETKEIVFKTHTELKQLRDIKVVIKDADQKPIKNLTIKLINDYFWHHAITDDNGIAIFNKIDCSKPTYVEIVHKGIKLKEQLDCSENTEFEFIVGIKPVKIIKYLIILLILVLVALVGYFGIKYLSQLNLKVDRGEVEHKDDQIIEAEKLVQQEFTPYMAKLYVLDSATKEPVVAEVKVGDSTYKVDKGSFELFVAKDSVMVFIVEAPEYFKKEASFRPDEVDTILLVRQGLYVANDTNCGAYIISPKVRYYIQSIKFDKPVSQFTFRFMKRFVSDEIRVYSGHKSVLSPDKLIWEHKGFMPDTLVTTVVLKQPDSVVTFEIKAGEKTTPSWRLKTYCR